MSDDWGWYFTSAERRTSILRDQLEEAHAAAAAQSSRLSSQLRTLQGSLETRLNALSAAFDAYVELGDIREQLAGFPDTTVVRRDVAVSIDALAHGRAAERVDDRGETYWLPHAANAVIGLVGGHPDAEAEDVARTLSPYADLFVVAACGALGHGTAVADRVPTLLTCDQFLSGDQVALWNAAVHGCFGRVLPSIRPVWSQALDAAGRDVGAWRSWCTEQAESRDVETLLNWIAGLVGADYHVVAGPTASTGPESRAAAGSQLRAVVTGLVAQGTDQEAPLLSRARELRQRIEHPGGSLPAPDEPEAAGPSVIDVVRRSLLEVAPGSPERVELVAWVGPALRAAAEAEAATFASLEPISERVRTPDGDIDVTSSGPPAAQVERAKSGLTARYPTSALLSGIAGGVAGVFLVLTIVAFALGSGWAFLTALVAIGAGVGAVRAEAGRRQRATSAREAIVRVDSSVADAQRKVSARIDARETARTKVAATLEAIRAAVPSQPAGTQDQAADSLNQA